MHPSKIIEEVKKFLKKYPKIKQCHVQNYLVEGNHLKKIQIDLDLTKFFN